MIEATAYFEAYRYVLEGLQEQKEDDLPFQRCVCVCKISFTFYLQGHISVYNPPFF